MTRRFIKRNPWMLTRASDMRTCDRKVSGVYVLYSNSQIVYVGQSRNAQWRSLEHRSRIQFDAVKIRRVDDKAERQWLERKLIYRLRPQMNALIPVVLREPWQREYAELR